MAKNPKKIPAIEQLSDESQALYDAINDERELPCVLISTSFLDQCLASLLERFFISGDTSKALLDPNRGALGSFAVRADLAYCLGLIPKGLCQNLRVVGEIRNRFAHSYLSLSFDDSKIIELCNSLTFPKFGGGKIINGEAGTSEDMVGPPEILSHPPIRFKACVAMMAGVLLSAGLSTVRRDKKDKGWN